MSIDTYCWGCGIENAFHVPTLFTCCHEPLILIPSLSFSWQSAVCASNNREEQRWDELIALYILRSTYVLVRYRTWYVLKSYLCITCKCIRWSSMIYFARLELQSQTSRARNARWIAWYLSIVQGGSIYIYTRFTRWWQQFSNRWYNSQHCISAVA